MDAKQEAALARALQQQQLQLDFLSARIDKQNRERAATEAAQRYAVELAAKYAPTQTTQRPNTSPTTSQEERVPRLDDIKSGMTPDEKRRIGQYLVRLLADRDKSIRI